MKLKHDTVKGIVLGSVLTLGLTASMGSLSAAGIYKKLEAAFNDIKVNIQGKNVELTDAKGQKVEPFIVDGTTYLPVRAIAEVLGQPDENLVDPFETITGVQPFYINNNGKLVISFNEYDVAPGYMGTVEFVIPTVAIEELLVSHQYIK